MAFNVGDEVQRKTGGPKMTVVGVTGETLICRWDQLGKEQQATVSADEVTLYHEEGHFGVC